MTEKDMNNSKSEFEQRRQEILREHQVVKDTSEERRILELLRDNLVSTEWAQDTFGDIRNLLVDYYKDSLLNIQDRRYIHDKTQELLSKIAARGNAKISSGQEHLDDIPKASPVFLLTNHLGIYKLAIINPRQELGLDDTGVDGMYCLPIFHASNKPVADALGDNLYIGAFEFPGKIGEIQKAAGGVIIRLEREEELEKEFKGETIEGIDHLITQTRNFIEQHPNGALSVLPEGKTSGKERGISPYDLAAFKTGAFVVAARLNIPILPVSQYFDPNTGFEVVVHEVIHLSPDLSREQFREVADSTREKMQQALDIKMGRRHQ